MAKYILTPTGEVKKTIDQTNFEDWNILETRLPSKASFENQEKSQSNKYSELTLGGGLIFSPNTFSPQEGILSFPANNTINSSQKLVNPSFGFNSNISSQEFYNSYNTVFDLDLENFDNSDGVQIFANNLEFFGFPQFTMNPVRSATELLYTVTTIVDMTIFAIIPIVTITILQQIIQNENANPLDEVPDLFNSGSSSKTKKANPSEDLFELGQYISYKKFSNGKDDLFTSIGKATLDVLIQTTKKILNSFESIMNFPKFKFPDSKSFLEATINLGKEILQRTLYFVLGYLAYLVPGFKIENVTLTFNPDNIIQSISDLLTTFITSSSSRHNFNFLIRKIIRNNHFRNKYLKGEARTTSPDFGFARSFSYFSSFIFRFIGERISAGEKIWRIDSRKFRNSFERFNSTREKSGKLIMRENIVVHENLDINRNDFFEIYEYKDRYIENFKAQKRANATEVKNSEDRINDDYMPFTFQDLRDNSIIKFHAYIDSISDSFSSNYNEIGGYGRVDKIKNLISTTRSINLSFQVVATSEEDFYIVWQKINRLVNMVYPQWTKGTAIREYAMKSIKKDFNLKYRTSENKNLDASTDPNRLIHTLKIPYSEIPSNSPMIRLRVGNLITSNIRLNELNNDITEGKKTKEGTDVINPFVKAFNSNSGRGLAGYITNLGIDWDQQTPWEIRPYIGENLDNLGQRPIFSKITIGFSPIHDVPLGLNFPESNELTSPKRSSAYNFKNT